MRFFRVQHAEGLFRVSFRVAHHFIDSHLRAQLVFVGRVTNQGCKNPDEESHIMPKLLKLAQFAHGDRVPQV